jgi:glutamyl-tRNA reductase
MSLLVLGLSHHRTPLDLLERAAADDASATAFERLALRGSHIHEALVLSTCNRTEVYADTLTFHGAISDLTAAFIASTDLPLDTLRPHLHVHYEERAVAHAFSVASGLEAMAVGEDQILGQIRSALARAQAHGHVGPQLNALLQQALRVGKRVHTETDVDKVSSSLVGVGLARAEEILGDLSQRSVLVIGAGGMGALAATAARRQGVARLLVANRDARRAHSLADRLDGVAIPWEEREQALADADVVIASTGAPGTVIRADAVERAIAARVSEGRGSGPQVLLDLALVHDIDRNVHRVGGATLLGLAELGALLSEGAASPEIAAARDMVTAEVVAYVAERAAEAVVPTVRALRATAEQILIDELARLDRRDLRLADSQRAEVERAMHRLIDKLLHTPTVRVKELAERGQGGDYARALSELFDLRPADVRMVSAPVDLPVWLETEGGRR